MIAYFDTSAVVPLIVEEPTSGECESVWLSSERVVSCRLLYPEARAALAAAQRCGRLSADGLRRAVDLLGGIVREIDAVAIDESLARDAGSLAEHHGLRGYDAVHLAAAAAVRTDQTVMVTGDHALRDAAAAAGLGVVNLS